MITIVNIKDFGYSLKRVEERFPDAVVVYCGRDNPRYQLKGGPLQNKVGQGLERRAAIAAFRRELWKDFQAQGPMYAEIVNLAGAISRGWDLVLVCYCAPEPCHTEVIRSAIEYWISQH